MRARAIVWILMAGLAAVGAHPARAGIMVGEFDWNDGTVQDWYDNQSWVGLDNPGSGGIDNSGYLRITVNATETQQGDPGAEWYALAQVTAANLFAGNWMGKLIEFDFFAQDTAPGYVQLRWKSSTNSSVWRATVYDSATTSMSTGVWSQLAGPSFTSYLDWNYGGASQEQFVNDLASIDWIGVYIWRSGSALQRFGLDDFRLTVPEPAELVMLLTAMLTAAMSLRRRNRNPVESVPAGG